MREIDQRSFLVTGGAGFIGSHLVDALVAAGARVAVLDDLSTGRRENIGDHLSAGEVDFIETSAVERDLVRALVADADVVVHLASAVGVQLVIGNPLETLLRNIRSADVVTEACADLGARLIFASTSEIYGKVDSPDPLDEGSDLIVGSPQTARWGYAAAKMVGEMMAYGYHRAGAAEAIVVRFFNTVGPRQTGVHGMVVPRLTGQALAGDDLTVYGDGRQLRCFTHVADAVDALLRLAVAPDSVCGRPFNIGNRDNEVTILELARMIIERSGSRSGVDLIPFDAVFGEGFEELGRRRPDTDALQRATGWQPSRTITEIVDDVVADMTAVPSGFERLLPARGGEALEA